MPKINQRKQEIKSTEMPTNYLTEFPCEDGEQHQMRNCRYKAIKVCVYIDRYVNPA